jgi:hypothetical protein
MVIEITLSLQALSVDRVWVYQSLIADLIHKQQVRPEVEQLWLLNEWQRSIDHAP